MVSNPKFGKYADALRKGALSLEDVRGASITPDDLLKMRLDAPQMFGMSETVKDKAFMPTTLEGRDRSKSYAYVSEAPIGSLHDLPLANAWEFTDFEQRKRPILYGHNIENDAPPIGRGFDVESGVIVNGVKTVVGGVEFRALGADPFVDMVYQAIEDEFLNGFSVGFRVEDARLPSKEEIDQYGLNEYATVLTRCNLTEGSIVPVGRDPRAGVLAYSQRGEALEAWLAGRKNASPDDIRRFRMELFGAKSDRTVVTVGKTLADDPKPSKDASPEPVEDKRTAEEKFTELYLQSGGDPDQAAEAFAAMQTRAAQNKSRPATFGELTEVQTELLELRTQNTALAAEMIRKDERMASIDKRLKAFEDALGGLVSTGVDDPTADSSATDLTPEESAALLQAVPA